MEHQMKRAMGLLVLVAVGVVCSMAWADYAFQDRGTWPKDWPAELEGLRKQARTLVGPKAQIRHYAIRFGNREEFEAAWPHLLKVRSKGAPVVLVRGENFFLGQGVKAGVVVYCPPEGQLEKGAPAAPIDAAEDLKTRWMIADRIEVLVDGEVVDLNRIQLPDGVVDERFKATN
jgi:hypothetical protein